MSYFLRNKCIFCDNTEFNTLFDNDYESSISLQMVETKENYDFMPYNILICNKCNAVQNKYLGNLDIVYGKNHEDAYGTTKGRKHTLFKDFIVSNNKIKKALGLEMPIKASDGLTITFEYINRECKSSK